MTYFVTVLVLIWICGLLLVAGRYLNDLRVVLNNVVPGEEVTMLPRRPNWLRDAAGVAPLASLTDLIFAGLALTVGRVLRLERWDSAHLSNCDPACLTEAGQVHLKRVAGHERFALGWMIGGLALLALWGSYHGLS